MINTLLMSMSRFAINHLLLSKKNENRLKRLQQKLVWGNRYVHLNKKYERLLVERKEFATQDVSSIRIAFVISWVTRMKKYSNLSWVQLTITLCLNSRSIKTRVKKITTSWKQQLNTTWQNVAKTSIMTHIWNVWSKKLSDLEIFDRLFITFRHSRNAIKVLNVNFWYFLRMLEKRQVRRRETKLWVSDTWERIVIEAYGNINILDDVYDLLIRQFRQLRIDCIERMQFQKTIDILMKNLSQEWMNLLRNASNAKLTTWIIETMFQHWEMIRTTAARRKEWKKLQHVIYKWVYKALMQIKIIEYFLNNRIMTIVTKMQRKLSRDVRSTELWKTIRNYKRVSKVNDLLYRLLLDVVKIESALSWETMKTQRCSLNDENQTIEHLWINCDIAQAMWNEFEATYATISRERVTRTRSTNRRNLVELFAIDSDLTGQYDRIRWHILYSKTVWQLWKLYLNNQFRQESLTTRETMTIYRTTIYHRVMINRALVLSSKYELRRRHIEDVFQRIWGESLLRVVKSNESTCLHRL